MGKKLWQEYDEDNKRFNDYKDEQLSQLNLREYLQLQNSDAMAARIKALWLGLVNLRYNDKYVGADLTGHWYRRNTRIFVNTRN